MTTQLCFVQKLELKNKNSKFQQRPEFTPITRRRIDDGKLTFKKQLNST